MTSIATKIDDAVHALALPVEALLSVDDCVSVYEAAEAIGIAPSDGTEISQARVMAEAQARAPEVLAAARRLLTALAARYSVDPAPGLAVLDA